MLVEQSIEVAVPADQVFEVYADVEGWPRWTPSVTSVERLDAGPLQVGSSARVKQPKLPPAVWHVTELEPGRSFTWTSSAAGLRSTGVHAVEPMDDGTRARVVARLEQRGVLAGLVGLLTRSLTERYVDAELRGLKAFCESGS